jgi:transposase
LRGALSDEAWSLVAPLFPVRIGGRGRPTKPPRLMLDAVLWVTRTGAPWRDLPAEFGKWQTVYHYFSRWRDEGTLSKVIAHLHALLGELNQLEHDLWLVDGTIVRASRAAAGGGKKASQ